MTQREGIRDALVRRGFPVDRHGTVAGFEPRHGGVTVERLSVLGMTGDDVAGLFAESHDEGTRPAIEDLLLGVPFPDWRLVYVTAGLHAPHLDRSGGDRQRVAAVRCLAVMLRDDDGWSFEPEAACEAASWAAAAGLSGDALRRWLLGGGLAPASTPPMAVALRWLGAGGGVPRWASLAPLYAAAGYDLDDAVRAAQRTDGTAPAPDELCADAVRAGDAMARAGRVPDGESRTEHHAKVRLVAKGIREHGLTADQAAAWRAADADNPVRRGRGAYGALLLHGVPVAGRAWFTDGPRLLAAGYSPDQAALRAALPPGHPDRPANNALARMAAALDRHRCWRVVDEADRQRALPPPSVVPSARGSAPATPGSDFSPGLRRVGVAPGIDVYELVGRLRTDLPEDWRWAHKFPLLRYGPFRMGRPAPFDGYPAAHPMGSWVAMRIATTPMSDLARLIEEGGGNAVRAGLGWHPEASDELLRSLGLDESTAARPDVCTRPDLLEALLTSGSMPGRVVFNVASVLAIARDPSPALPVLHRLLPWAPPRVKRAFVAGLERKGANRKKALAIRIEFEDALR